MELPARKLRLPEDFAVDGVGEVAGQWITSELQSIRRTRDRWTTWMKRYPPGQVLYGVACRCDWRRQSARGHFANPRGAQERILCAIPHRHSSTG